MNYADLLQRKAAVLQPVGREVDAGAIHPKLYAWQARITRWACKRGRAAIFADCGLGKTFMQLEWARLMADRSLIVAPLSVARQTVREGAKLGIEPRYVREQRDVDGTGIYVTNYEMVERFTPSKFGAVVLDESSILKNVDGKTRKMLTERFASIPYRLACTATPAPNDSAELTNHAEYLGVMSRVEMLAAYFVHDDEGWRLKGHAAGPMHRWMASWAVALRTPSDIGGDDEGYILPPLDIRQELVDVKLVPEGQLFATGLGGIQGRSAIRRATLGERVKRTAELAQGDDQWIIWTALNDEARETAALIDGAENVEGSWTPEAKARALEAFQDGDIRVLVTKPSIAGFGMNFQNCHRMAFCGLGDSYEAYYQAIRRCWRFGQKEPVEAVLVLAEIEQEIAGNVRRKETEARGWTDGLIAEMREWELADV